MTTTDVGAREAFARVLQRDESDWGWAKSQAFAALCELDPSADGPGPRTVARVLRGRLDDRIPLDWQPVFVETCHQWQGFSDAGGHDAGTRRATDESRRVAGCLAVLGIVVTLGILATIALAIDGALEPEVPVRDPPSRSIPSDLTARIAAQASLSASGRDEDIEALLAGDYQLVHDYREARRALLGAP